METHRLVKIWLFIGLVMLLVQVIVGGITRITGSGLSITKWEIVTGTLPPMSEEAWNAEFDLYKETPQYKEINEGMLMGSIFESGTFKFIYFWEWFHRLWARTMGFVFLLPLIFFLIKKWIDPPLMKRLIVVFFLAALAASFGWIMVASGLVERPWVNAYKLSLHLTIAFIVYSYLLWTLFKVTIKEVISSPSFLKKLGLWVTAILWIQIFLGGVMSGMKAGVVYPTWPDMNGVFFPQIIFDSSQWNVENFNYYDRNTFMPALIQVLHRSTAYILFIFGLYYGYRIMKSSISPSVNKGAILFIILLISQVLLGILTIINCQGSIPLFYGVMHQGFALLLLSSALYLNYRFK